MDPTSKVLHQDLCSSIFIWCILVSWGLYGSDQHIPQMLDLKFGKLWGTLCHRERFLYNYCSETEHLLKETNSIREYHCHEDVSLDCNNTIIRIIFIDLRNIAKKYSCDHFEMFGNLVLEAGVASLKTFILFSFIETFISFYWVHTRMFSARGTGKIGHMSIFTALIMSLHKAENLPLEFTTSML